jgi:hypothetical protein
MKFGRFEHHRKAFYGIVEGNAVEICNDQIDVLRNPVVRAKQNR